MTSKQTCKRAEALVGFQRAVGSCSSNTLDSTESLRYWCAFTALSQHQAPPTRLSLCSEGRKMFFPRLKCCGGAEWKSHEIVSWFWALQTQLRLFFNFNLSLDFICHFDGIGNNADVAVVEQQLKTVEMDGWWIDRSPPAAIEVRYDEIKRSFEDKMFPRVLSCSLWTVLKLKTSWENSFHFGTIKARFSTSQLQMDFTHLNYSNN